MSGTPSSLRLVVQDKASRNSWGGCDHRARHPGLKELAEFVKENADHTRKNRLADVPKSVVLYRILDSRPVVEQT